MRRMARRENWDINLKRDFRITETMKIRLQVDDLNATNHTNFSCPSTDPTSGNFGKITSTILGVPSSAA